MPVEMVAITLQQAKALTKGTVLNLWDTRAQDFVRNADNTRARYKVTSVKTWKTRPDEIRIRVQRGYYAKSGAFIWTQENLWQIYIQPAISK